MFSQLFADLGAWSWFVLGFLLLTAEMLVPGVLLMWFGLAALVTGLLSFVFFEGFSWWTWQLQLVCFSVLSLISVLLGKQFFPTNQSDDEASSINQPLQKMIGRQGTMVGPLENGAGRMKLGDTTWRVRGPDIGDGSKVLVTAEQDGDLIVEKA